MVGIWGEREEGWGTEVKERETKTVEQEGRGDEAVRWRDEGEEREKRKKTERERRVGRRRREGGWREVNGKPEGSIAETN